MGCGCTTITNTCGEKLYAACTFYEGTLPNFTTLIVNGCYTLEEVVADLYLILTTIKDEIDLSSLLSNDISYTLESGVVVTKNALEKHAELILALEASVTGLKDGTDTLFDITDWGLTLGCIADACDNPPTLLKDLSQLLIDQVCTIENKTGVLDYNDLFTATTPIAVTGGGGAVYLTNDGLGAFTNKNYPPFGVTDIWNASLNHFDFTELNLGATVHLRIDLSIVTNVGNQDVDVEIELGIGGTTYTLGVDHRSFKSAGTYQINATTFVYMGDANTKDFAGKFKVKSDGDVSVTVNGWACNIINY